MSKETGSRANHKSNNHSGNIRQTFPCKITEIEHKIVIMLSAEQTWCTGSTGDNNTLVEYSMRCDTEWFYIKGSLTATENGTTVFERMREEKVAREFV